jgi:tetratricopeptide (TPR) repeat protein
MPIDRASTLRNAEKLLRQGRLDAAIAEYARVVEDNAGDWNTANILGDLYVRVGQTDKAVEQFIRIADSLHEQGFLPKAAALYKKILKLKPDHEQVMLQAGEIAGQQGFYADARAHFGAVAARRSARGDTRGVAAVRIRLGSIDAGDFDARLAAAGARLEIEDVSGAVRDFLQIAADLVEKQRYAEAVHVLDRAAAVLPIDDQAGRARAHDLLQMIAEGQLQSGSVDAGLDTLMRMLDHDVSRCASIVGLAGNMAVRDPDAALRVIELAIRGSIADGDWPAAAAALTELVARAPHDVPALMRLVEICVDGGLEEELDAAQVQLAEAYLAAGQPAEARYIAEDLVTRRPGEPAHVDRLRRTLVLLGEADPDTIIAERLGTASSTPVDPPVDEADPSRASGPAAIQPSMPAPSGEPAHLRSEPVASIEPPAHAEGAVKGAPAHGQDRREPEAPSPAHAERQSPVRPRSDVFELSSNAVDIESIIREFDSPPPQTGSAENFEVDLSVVLDDMNRLPDPVRVAPREATLPRDPHGSDIEDVFAQLRDEASRRSALDAAEQEFRRALALKAAGDIDACVAALQSASKTPKLRFRTASLLGRLFRERGRIAEAAEWYERAAQAPAPTPDEYHVLLFELAEVLEEEGEIVRALAVCLELQADAGDYRDVATRVDRLAKAQARG